MPRLKILVAEDEPELREIIVFMLESRFQAQILVAATGNEAIDLIKSNAPVSCVISDYSMPNGTGEDVFRFLTRFDSAVPFVLCSAYHPSKYPVFAKSEIFGHVIKPLIYEPLLGLVEKLSLGLPAKDSQGASHYSPLGLDTALLLGGAVSDLYVKLGENKFVKIFHRGARVDRLDSERLRKKGIDRLFVATEDADRVLRELIANVSALSRRAELTGAESIKISAAAVGILSGFAQSFAVDGQLQVLVEENVQSTIKQIRADSTEHWKMLADLINGHGYLSNHSVVTAHVACWIAGLMGWKSDLTFRKLILASFFHDIILPGDALARLRTEKELQEKDGWFLEFEKASFLRHPEMAADLLGRMRDLPPGADLIVRQHHELADGSGFPSKLQTDEIAPLSCVFIVAHEIVTVGMTMGRGFNLKSVVAQLAPQFTRGTFKNALQSIADHLGAN
jgi:response regulator RpfG family c-di-GMP phosphodiesterase